MNEKPRCTREVFWVSGMVVKEPEKPGKNHGILRSLYFEGPGRTSGDVKQVHGLMRFA